MQRWAWMGALIGLATGCHTTTAHTLPLQQRKGTPVDEHDAGTGGLLPRALTYRPLSAPPPDDARRRFLLRTDAGARLLALVRPAQPHALAHPGGIVVEHGTLPEAVEAKHRAPSFFLGNNPPDVDALADALPTPPTPSALRAAVASYFREHTSEPLLGVAPAVEQRRGVCTEHPLLTAALARAVGMPARVVVGYVLLPEATPPVALGHAWTQVHDGHAWRTVDASPVGQKVHEYLIMGTLDDEGPDYRAQLDARMRPLAVDGVEAL